MASRRPFAPTGTPFYDKFAKYNVGRMWRADRSILPCDVYLRHCLLAAKALGQHELDNFLDTTILADRTTMLRCVVIVGPSSAADTQREEDGVEGMAGLDGARRDKYVYVCADCSALIALASSFLEDSETRVSFFPSCSSLLVTWQRVRRSESPDHGHHATPRVCWSVFRISRRRQKLASNSI